MTIDVATRARSFDAWAGEYDRYRPGYPAALFALIAERLELLAVPRVADLGAGTGKAALAMARRGWRVTAVEPGRAMPEVLRARAADEGLALAAVESPAEETGLPDASVDVAMAAQAFHFFDAPRALAEMARIVRVGGGVALFWNVRDDERSPFLRDYTALLERFVRIGHLERGLAEEEVDTRAAMEAAGDYAEIGRRDVPHEVASDAEHFIARRHHRSGRFTIPYRVECWTARRVAA